MVHLENCCKFHCCVVSVIPPVIYAVVPRNVYFIRMADRFVLHCNVIWRLRVEYIMCFDEVWLMLFVKGETSYIMVKEDFKGKGGSRSRSSSPAPKSRSKKSASSSPGR